MTLKHTLNYFKNFIRDKKVASITPCSKYTIRRLCEKIDYSDDQVIVEYGPGSGGFTEYLLSRMTESSRLITIEINEDFVKNLGKLEAKDSRLSVYQDGAENLLEILKKENISKINNALSGIPFSFIPKETRQEILKNTHSYLEREGKFLLYQTSYNMVPELEGFFREVHKDYEFKNLPPMHLMEAVK